VKRALVLALGLGLVLAAPAAQAYCPSYTLSSSSNTYKCGIEAVPGKNPSIAEWQGIFDLVAKGPSVWGSAGPAVGDIGQGCGKPEPLHSVPARFPCELLKAIAMAESGWKQFCVPNTPADQVGGAERTIISFDCGYGVGQVTSGMHIGETPNFDRQRVAAEATYNLATGTQILASKWKATQCVGDNQPSIVENWYSAVWAYNGLAYVNNPSNPNYSSSRGVWNPSVGGAAPYQEKVLGRVEHPSGNPAYWNAVALAYPDPADVGGASSPPALPEPSCASPTDCAATRGVHVSDCFATEPPPDAGTGGQSGAGGASAGAGGQSGQSSGGTPGSGGAGGVSGNSGNSGNSGADSDAGQTSAGLASDDLEGSCACRAGGRPRERSSSLLLVLVALMLRRRGATP
jgi:hypothetical protein